MDERDKILKSFLQISNPLRMKNNNEIKWKCFPFIIDNYAYVSNGAILTRYPNEILQYHKQSFNTPDIQIIGFNCFDNKNNKKTLDSSKMIFEFKKNFKKLKKLNPCECGNVCNICYGTGLDFSKTDNYKINNIVYDPFYIYLIYRYLDNLTLYPRLFSDNEQMKNALGFTFGKDNKGQGVLMNMV